MAAGALKPLLCLKFYKHGLHVESGAQYKLQVLVWRRETPVQQDVVELSRVFLVIGPDIEEILVRFRKIPGQFRSDSRVLQVSSSIDPSMAQMLASWNPDNCIFLHKSLHAMRITAIS